MGRAESNRYCRKFEIRQWTSAVISTRTSSPVRTSDSSSTRLEAGFVVLAGPFDRQAGTLGRVTGRSSGAAEADLHRPQSVDRFAKNPARTGTGKRQYSPGPDRIRTDQNA